MVAQPPLPGGVKKPRAIFIGPPWSANHSETHGIAGGRARGAFTTPQAAEGHRAGRRRGVCGEILSGRMAGVNGLICIFAIRKF